MFDLMIKNRKRYGYVAMVQEFEWCVVGLWEAAGNFSMREDVGAGGDGGGLCTVDERLEQKRHKSLGS